MFDRIVECDDGNDSVEDNDDDSEKEDDIIKPNDNLLLVGHVEGDASILEVYGEYTDNFEVCCLGIPSNVNGFI